MVAIAALYLTVKTWFLAGSPRATSPICASSTRPGSSSGAPSEISLDKVESVDVNQSILGRLLNYGDVTILGVGEGRETISTIASPLDFRNFITAR